MRLHVNVDHVATVRNARGTRYPDPVYAAQICEAAGADGITAHLREDRRHISDEDVARLRATISTRLNLEMAATAEMCSIAEKTRPDVVTLVPERRAERTTEGGLDLEREREGILRVLEMARRAGIKVSLFIDPDVAVVEQAQALGVDQVELHTGEYCHAWAELPAPATRSRLDRQLGRLCDATAKGCALGLEVAAGHGLTRHNVGPVVAIRELVEVNIGHAIVADAIFLGLEGAVREMRAAVERAR